MKRYLIDLLYIMATTALLIYAMVLMNTAQAGWYFGTGIGVSKSNFDANRYLSDYVEANDYRRELTLLSLIGSGVQVTENTMRTGPGFQKIYIGADINPRWATELSYFSLGDFKASIDTPHLYTTTYGVGLYAEGHAEAQARMRGIALQAVRRFEAADNVRIFISFGGAQATGLLDSRVTYRYGYELSRYGVGEHVASDTLNKSVYRALVPVIGVGAEWHITPRAGLRLAVERYGYPVTGERIDSYYGGVFYRFK